LLENLSRKQRWSWAISRQVQVPVLNSLGLSCFVRYGAALADEFGARVLS